MMLECLYHSCLVRGQILKGHEGIPNPPLESPFFLCMWQVPYAYIHNQIYKPMLCEHKTGRWPLALIGKRIAWKQCIVCRFSTIVHSTGKCSGDLK